MTDRDDIHPLTLALIIFSAAYLAGRIIPALIWGI